MSQLLIKVETIIRIEKITGQHIMRGGDKMINMALDLLEKKIQELQDDHVCRTCGARFE